MLGGLACWPMTYYPSDAALRVIQYKKTFIQGRRVYEDIDVLYRKYDITPLYVRRKQQLLSSMYDV